MKVVFVQPRGNNWFGEMKDITSIFNVMPPHGMLSIAAVLEKNGIACDFLDCFAFPLSADAAADQVVASGADVAAFSCTTSSFLEGYRTAEFIKAKRPDIRIVLGGAHACAIGAPLLDSFPALDVLVLGEGEMTMLELVSGGFSNLPTVDGIAYRGGDGKGIATPPRAHIANLDDLPFPAYHLLPGFPKEYKLPLFSYPKSPNTSLISSRGCPYQCSYCDRSVFSKGFRFNSPEYIVEHMSLLHRNYGIRHVAFYDDLFTFNKERVAQFCRLKEERRVPVTYNCIARLEHVDAELVALLKRSGCWQVNFGIESGDPEIIRKHRKYYDLDEVGVKLKMVKDAGMRVKGLFMIGIPGETEAAIRRTIDYACMLPLDEINVTKFTPFPGAPIYRTIREHGEFNEEWPLMNCMNFVFIPTGLTKERLEELYNEFIRSFYRRSRIHHGYAKMLWKSPHSVATFMRHLPELISFQLKQKW